MSAKRLVLFITDSLGLPRFRSQDPVNLAETYVQTIKTLRPEMEIVHVGIPAAPITELSRVAAYYQGAVPDFVVLHSGIVDCAPRALGPFELEVVKRLRAYRLVKPFIKKLRRYRNVYYTAPREFEDTLLEIKQLFAESKLVAIGILPGCEAYERLVPGISDRIESFNSILREHTDFVDNGGFPREGISDDHHHLNVAGNLLLAKKILDKLA